VNATYIFKKNTNKLDIDIAAPIELTVFHFAIASGNSGILLGIPDNPR
jgi:hypothetical protein